MTDKPLNCVGSDKAQHDFNKHPALGLEEVVTQEKQQDNDKPHDDPIFLLELMYSHEFAHEYKIIRAELERAQRMEKALNLIASKNVDVFQETYRDIAKQALSDAPTIKPPYVVCDDGEIKQVKPQNDVPQYTLVHNNPDYYVIKKNDVDGDVMGALEYVLDDWDAINHPHLQGTSNDLKIKLIKAIQFLITQSDPDTVTIPRKVFGGDESKSDVRG